MTPDKLIEKYVQLREKKRKLEAELEEAIKPYTAGLAVIENELLRQLVELNVENVRTEFGTAYRTTALSATMEDRAKMLDALAREEISTDIFTNHVSKDYVKSFVETHGKPPPGIKIDTFVKVNVRKS